MSQIKYHISHMKLLLLFLIMAVSVAVSPTKGGVLDWFSSSSKGDYSNLHSEIPWISVNRVITTLEASGFKQVMNNPELIEYRKQMNADDKLHAVCVGISIDPSTQSIWSYRVVRGSTPQTWDFDTNSFASACAAICGVFVSEKEGQDISQFINKPLAEARIGLPAVDSMTFQNAFLKAECELVIETDATKEITQSFLVSSKE